MRGCQLMQNQQEIMLQLYVTPSHGGSGHTHPVAGAFQLVLQLDNLSLSLHTEEIDQLSKQSGIL